MGSNALFLLVFIASNWFSVYSRRWGIYIFVLSCGIFCVRVCGEFYLKLLFSSIAFLCSQKSRQNPTKQWDLSQQQGLGFPPPLAFYWLHYLDIPMSYPQMGSALQVAQELQSRTAKCPAERRCRHIVPCKQKAENCNIYLQSSVTAVCRCCFLLDPSVVCYTLPSGRKDIHCYVPFLI